MTATVLVFGGHGFYGRRLVQDLLQWTDASIVVAGRHPTTRFWPGTRVTPAEGDIGDQNRVRQLVDAADVVVHCAGPFQDLPIEPAIACVDAGRAYVDLSEDREYTRRVRELDQRARRSGALVMNGLSVVPGMEMLFTRMAAEELDEVRAVRSFAAPDTKRHRGGAMFHTMLYGAGRPYPAPRGGVARTAYGWTEAEWVEFPVPIGRRLTYLVLEMADLDLLPEAFGALTVDFKAGCEWPSLNRMLSLGARIRIVTGHPHLERWTQIVRGFSWLIGRFGQDAGGVVFKIDGLTRGQPSQRSYAVVAEKEGCRIPAVLAGIAVTRILAGIQQGTGVVPLDGWISADDLLSGLLERGLSVWFAEDGSGWRRIPTPAQVRAS